MDRCRLAVRLMLTLVIALTWTDIAGAWGRDGHAIVAEIAWRELSDEAKEEIKSLLGRSSLAEVSSWADMVRREPDYQWSAPLHYVNMAADASRYDHERDCPDEGCVVSAIDRFAGVLKDRSRSPQERGEALMFVVHFVGDLHQPLHGGRSEDRGGNSIDITLFGQSTNLHSAWDSGILNASGEGAWPARADRLYAEIEDVDRAAWLAGTVRTNWIDTAGRWAFESHHLAEEYAYCLAPGAEADRAYVDRCAPIAELRLQQAGVRLAAVLEACLGPGSAGSHTERESE